MKSNFIFGDMTFFENFKKPCTPTLQKPCTPTFGFRVKNAPFSGGGVILREGGIFQKCSKLDFGATFVELEGLGSDGHGLVYKGSKNKNPFQCV